MAKVLVLLKILPEDINIELEELKERIRKALPEGYEIKGYDIEPIAFGLKALRLYIFMPEKTEGGTEPLENTVMNVEGVSQVEVEAVHRIT
ncbi:elongation factor 1-beta [Staphylothermus hellenicus]|uniref:Elongation factor 1-beta n=1 Tax=Staphylothermus hellenicus (strain DSM 12710 / JCM 10830 / BK20S6-10-b1 / P8) TaxID=591019 RepID=D7DAM7_STAHD|nr:elongation factor 1-beta [Staphylothermus hellenicus]ADI31224.1 translation elongation factor aEF-1 beta [Staphylothermus hellenicus DSM 12710]